jgi:hypothetical protein
VNLLWLLYDEAILHQLSDILACKYIVENGHTKVYCKEAKQRFQYSNKSSTLTQIKIERAQETEKITTPTNLSDITISPSSNHVKL